MSVDIEFVLDDAEVTALKDDLFSASDGALQQTYLLTPVRLCVNGTDLFGLSDGSSSLALPLLHIAVLGSAALHSLRDATDVEYPLPGTGLSLRLHRRGEVVCAQVGESKEACAELSEFLAAIRRFKHQVAEDLSRRVPKIARHRRWKDWFETR